MRTLWLVILLAIGESLGFGQLDSDTLTVSVFQSFIPPPDQVVFSASVNTGVNTGLDEVIAQLKSSGITSAIFSGLYSDVDPPALHWFFTVLVPFSEMQATIARLTGPNLAFDMRGAQVSQQLREVQPCSMSSLMASAQGRAKKMADAVELVVGQVLELSDENGFGVGYKQPGGAWFAISGVSPINAVLRRQ